MFKHTKVDRSSINIKKRGKEDNTWMNPVKKRKKES